MSALSLTNIVDRASGTSVHLDKNVVALFSVMPFPFHALNAQLKARLFELSTPAEAHEIELAVEGNKIYYNQDYLPY
uniref:DNA-directed RNA polymerase n=1 Tax=Panagrellus redivivus TaxID=6233 RepID=A0A7E4VLK4_PANRE